MPASNQSDNSRNQSATNRAQATPMRAASLGSLRQYVQKREPAPAASRQLEHCELCNDVIPEEHRHLLELSRHEVICACQACSLLFSERGAAGGKYLLIPNRYLALTDFQMSDEQWESLAIPVNMVYIFRSTAAQRVMAFYPSPAGAMESLLDLESWEELASANPILNEMEPDVEALLINRVRNSREHYIVPIDACYQLVGLIRVTWRGLSGGEQAWKAIADYFAGIKAKSRPAGTGIHGPNENGTSGFQVKGTRGESDARPEL
ncbi:MAG TPA: DUF5947 family protein [Ktedonobacteraceae bacterium]|nr:DUF5947 family protein [Ktedonobacteraceae bacterium]